MNTKHTRRDSLEAHVLGITAPFLNQKKLFTFPQSCLHLGEEDYFAAENGGEEVRKLEVVMTCIRSKLRSAEVLFASFGLVCLLAFGVPFHLVRAQSSSLQDTTWDDYYEGEYYEDTGDDWFFGDDYSGEQDYFEDSYEDTGYTDYDWGNEDLYYDDDTYYDEGEFYDEEGFNDYYYEDEYTEEGTEAGEVPDQLDLANEQAGEVELEQLPDEKEIRKPRVIRGYTAQLAVASPWHVGRRIRLWNSFLDMRFALELAKKMTLRTWTISYTVELTTFSFWTYFPPEGYFSGIAALARASVPLGPVDVTVGVGLFAPGLTPSGFPAGLGSVTQPDADSNLGVIAPGGMVGLSYTIPFIRFMDLTVETRAYSVSRMTTEGASYWIDIGGSLGFRF